MVRMAGFGPSYAIEAGTAPVPGVPGDAGLLGWHENCKRMPEVVRSQEYTE
jgi:hypothetical protein